jgi:lipopolysaccharide transport system permease protein
MTVGERQTQMPLSEMQVAHDQWKDTSKPAVTQIQPSSGWRSPNFRELWTYRELLYFLVWRDVKVMYKQTVIGAAWAIIQPLMTMLIFLLVFKKIANIESDGLPYPIFAYSALLPWNLFAAALSRSSTSLVSQSNLISKVYFPRLIVPVSAAISGIVDFGIAFVILIVMMSWFRIMPTWGILFLPFFMILALTAALSVGLWLSALNVRYRDVGHTVPFLMQLWMFASPIAYPLSLVPQQWRFVYSLNPMVGVIEGFRWALLGKASPHLVVIASSTTAVLALLFGGIIYFKRMERTFADVV